MVISQPVYDFSDLQPTARAVAQVHKLAAELGIDEGHGLKLGITGDAPLGDEEFGSIEENMGLIGLLMAAAMMLDHCKLPELAGRLRKAIDATLNADKVRTGDLGGTASTAAFTKALASRISSG